MRTVIKTVNCNLLNHKGSAGRKVSRLSPLDLLSVILLTVVFVFSACTDDRGESSVVTEGVGAGQPILFATDGFAAGATTRTAVGTITDYSDLCNAGFGVFAANTGTHDYISSSFMPDFMYNQPVSYSLHNGVWTYSPLKYWPNADEGRESHLHFFAYAPFSKADGSDKASKCITSFSNNFDMGDPWLVYQLGGERDNWQSAQVDLLYAFSKDQQRNSTTPKVSLNFRHALAGAGDQLTVVTEDSPVLQARLKAAAVAAGKEVRLFLEKLTLNYTLLRKGRLVLNGSSSPNWQSIDSEDATVHRVVSISPASRYELARTNSTGTQVINTSYQTDNLGIFYIPIEQKNCPQKVKITAEYSIATGEDITYNGVMGTTIVLDGTAGDNQNFRLNFGDNVVINSSEDVSLFLRIMDIADQTYTGNALEPTVMVVSSDGRILTEGSDYTLAYVNNTNAATTEAANPPTVSATGVNDYQGGIATRKFTILKATGAVNFQNQVYTLTTGATYTNVLLNAKGTVVKVGNGDTDDVATVKYVSSNPSVATVNETTGAVTAVTAGNAIITVFVTDSRNYTYPVKMASYYLTVTAP